MYFGVATFNCEFENNKSKCKTSLVQIRSIGDSNGGAERIQ